MQKCAVFAGRTEIPSYDSHPVLPRPTCIFVQNEAESAETLCEKELKI